MKPFIATLLAVWFLAVFFLGANGAFVMPPDKPPFPILIGVLAPLAVFILAYVGSSAFRAFILSVDPVLLSSIQGWRAAGLGFLSLAAHGVLPWLFAWPAGLGDIAIGVTAPWVVQALVRRPAFVTSPIFKVWNLLGILDLVNAVSMGALNSGFIPGVVGHVTTAPVAQLPLVLIPGFLVPFFIMLHLSALFQARRHSSAPSKIFAEGFHHQETMATKERA
ncbi:MAG TPA: hypothetical protein VGY77_05860 [Gemmataceae bacterium]|nr:hypothetical protein [Gemmataceae bacterium]